MVKKVGGPAVRLVDDTHAALAAMPTESAVTLVDISAACREGLMGLFGLQRGVTVSSRSQLGLPEERPVTWWGLGAAEGSTT